MRLDVVIRVAGSSRSPSDHIAALLPEYAGTHVNVMVTSPYAGEGFEVLTDAEQLQRRLADGGDGVLLAYGEEQLLGRIKGLKSDTIWMAVGSGTNPLRNVWRLRGGYPWLGSARLALILEDETAGTGLENSQLLTSGRIARVVTMPVAAPVAAMAAPAAEIPVVEEMPAVGDIPVVEQIPVSEEAPAVAETPVVEEAPAFEAAPAFEGMPVIEETPTAQVTAVDANAAAPVTAEPAEDEAEDLSLIEELLIDEHTALVAAAAMTAPAAEPETAEVPAEVTAIAADIPAEVKNEPVTPEGASEQMTEPVSTTLLEGERSTEQALLTRYSLVKERRRVVAKIAEVEETLNALIKESLVSRYNADIESARGFEALTGKMARFAAEYRELLETRARVLKGLDELAWLKDELEM